MLKGRFCWSASDGLRCCCEELGDLGSGRSRIGGGCFEQCQNSAGCDVMAQEIERSGLSARGRGSSEKADTARPISSSHAARYGTRGHARSTRSARNER